MSAAEAIEREVRRRVDELTPELLPLVEEEIGKRVDILDKAFQKRFELANNLNKINRADEVKKAKEAIEKHENALEKALSSNDFSKLKSG